MFNWIKKGMDKVIWVVIGGIAATVFTTWYQDKSPEIIVSQYYNSYDSRQSVPEEIGGLKLEYSDNKVIKKLPDEYIVMVSNENGNGPEENLKMQILFPTKYSPKYLRKPNLKLFKPRVVNLDEKEFYMELGSFPEDAKTEIAFVAPKNKMVLCNVAIEVAGKNKMGIVKPIKGVECD